MPDTKNENNNTPTTAANTTPEVGEQMPEPKGVKAAKAKAEAGKKKTAQPSVRTLKKQIKELTEEVAAKDAEVKTAIDKALMFQEIAGNAKATIDTQNRELKNVLTTLRGSVVTTINTIDLILGGLK